MLTKAVRLYGANDLRVENFSLPDIGPGEVLIKVVSDSLCASTYKAVIQGSAHKRVPEDISENPIIIGHEMCGTVLSAGAGVSDKWKPGQNIVIQPALKLESGYDPGYSYRYIGGNSVYAVVPEIVLERGCLIKYNGEGFYKGSLVEAIGCVLRAFKGMYHTDYSTYTRTDGAKRGGRLAILGGAGPMGLAAVELAVNYAGCRQVVVTDLDESRLEYAAKMYSPKSAAEKGVDLRYVNTSGIEDVAGYLKEISNGGFDDAFVMVPVPALVTQAEAILGEDGCLNFFAGPPVHELQGSLNLYRVHYDGIHLIGTAGSIPEDTVDVIRLIENGVIDPSGMVSHIMGMDAVPDSIFAMKKPSGAKKVCYNELDIPCIEIAKLAEYGKNDPMYARLAEIVGENGGRWCMAAEKYLLENAPRVKI